MTNNIGWKKLRVLVTNKCNYRCPFCHNEGQEKVETLQFMDFDRYTKLIWALRNEHLDEINFSGGEPFLNKEIVDMIVFANNNTSCDISCATNLSLISDEQLARLSNTRVKFNIQFPYVEEKKFSHSTGNGDIKKILANVIKVRQVGLNIGLNSVVQLANKEEVGNMVRFAIEQELPLKLLPQLGLKGSSKYKEFIFPILEKFATERIDKKTGAIRWVVEENGHRTSVLYIDSPCFQKDISQCRNYGEIRIHPDFSLQPCILNSERQPLNMDSEASIINTFNHLWKNFNQCL